MRKSIKALLLIQRMISEVGKDTTKARQCETLAEMHQTAMRSATGYSGFAHRRSRMPGKVSAAGQWLALLSRRRPLLGIAGSSRAGRRLDVRKIRDLLLAGHKLIPLEDCKRLRAKTWATDTNQRNKPASQMP